MTKKKNSNDKKQKHHKGKGKGKKRKSADKRPPKPEGELTEADLFKEFNLKLSNMAHGGSAVGRDNRGRVIFVNGGIPGETVRVRVPEGDGKKKQTFAQGELLEVVTRSEDRVDPKSEVTYGVEYQHIAYARQLKLKADVVADQFRRLAKLKPTIKPTIPSPVEWDYLTHMQLSPTEDGKFGVWSPEERRVTDYQTTHLPRPALENLIQNFDFELPDLRKISLRVGDDDALLAAMEVNSVEPPDLHTDFPISVSLVLPDKTAANLIGENYTVQEINGHNFRVSAGSHQQPNPVAWKNVIDTVLNYADLNAKSEVLELYAGVGTLTYFLAQKAKTVTTVEVVPDAVNDLSINLHDTENVEAYQDWAEAVLPDMDITPDVIVVDPPEEGLSKFVIQELSKIDTQKLIYVSSDVAKLARDAKLLIRNGYELVEVQPIDLLPQTFHIHSVSLWVKQNN